MSYDFGKLQQLVLILFVFAASLSIFHSYFTVTNIETGKKNLGKQSLVNHDIRIKRVGMLAPYAIVPGDNERYFFASAKTFLQQGYHVIVMVFEDNPCRTVECLRQTVNTLRIDLDCNKIEIRVVQRNGPFRIKDLEFILDTFYLLGNNTVPSFDGIGTKLNIYMCQYSFETNLNISTEHSKALASYDLVFVNSEHTYKRYGKAIQPVLDEIKKLNLVIPSVRILNPPVNTFPVVSRLPIPTKDTTINIVMIASFLGGDQSAGIEIFLNLLKKSNRKLHLTLIGNIDPKSDSHKCEEEIRKNVAGLPVSFLLEISPEIIFDALSKSNIFWHLRGISQLGQDDHLEHFESSIVEAMSAGCIPIVLETSGTKDIVTHKNNGYLAGSKADFVSYSLELIQMESQNFEKVQQQSILTSSKFQITKFLGSFETTSNRFRYSNTLRKAIIPVMSDIRKINIEIPISSHLIAVIIEPDISSLLEFVIYNVMLNLNRYSSWSLQVYYSEKNELFIKSVLSSFPNVNLIKLPFPVANTHDYNRLLKFPEFWKNIKSISTSYSKIKSLENCKVLIFQSDTIIVNNNKDHNINQYLEWDYIGAAWDGETNLLIKQLRQNGILNGSVGNGGFSLRTLDKMIEITSIYQNETSIELNQEDIFFAHFSEKMGFKVPDDYTAYKFAKEVSIPRFYEDSSKYVSVTDFDHFAYHAAWYYMDSGKFIEVFNKVIDSMINRGKM